MNKNNSHDDALRQLLSSESEQALLFNDNGLLVAKLSQEAFLPWHSLIQKIHFQIEVAHRDERNLILKGHTDLTDNQLSALGYGFLPIRAFLNQSTPEMQRKVMRAYHWLNWNKHSRFCGQCGSILTSLFDKLEKHCDKCDLTIFPKSSPAVMVLLHRKNELLLARSPHFQPGVYSAIAGFVEIGESAEEAASREVHEELGLHINELCYFSTQTWPFPDSFMIAFTSSEPQGELLIDNVEIEDAKWFNVRNLPTLPTSASISRHLIESTIKKILV